MRIAILCTLAVLVGSLAARSADKPAGAKETFAAKCASCHNADGKGKPAMAKMFKVDAAVLDLTVTKLDEAGLSKVIKEGRNKMPKFAGKLDDAAIKSVVEYVVGLKPAPKK